MSNISSNVSTAGVGMYVFLIMTILHFFGLEPDVNTVEGAVMGGITLISFFVWVVGQITRRDLKAGIVRK